MNAFDFKNALASLPDHYEVLVTDGDLEKLAIPLTLEINILNKEISIISEPSFEPGSASNANFGTN